MQMRKIIPRIDVRLFIILQCIWGLPQTLVGFLLFLINMDKDHLFYNGSILIIWNRSDGISLGLFIFVPYDNSYSTSMRGYNKSIAKHEYGHTIQSLILGPLYLPIVGLVSFLWCRLPIFKRIRREKAISYSYCFTESWADRLGERFIG